MGKTCRVRFEANRCVDLGHIIDDRWVNPKELARHFWPDVAPEFERVTG